jgi:membrane protease YdiL (CAAX protease family)
MLATLSNVVKRYPLLIFFILAYALSWWLVPLGGLLPYGPLLAAIIVLAFSQGKAGLKVLFSQMAHWRVGWIWYLIAPGIIIAYTAGAIGLNLLLGASISPSYEPVSGVDLLMLVILFLLLGGMWEEPGWTGYALPRLRTARSLLLASLILGVFRNIWHLPLFLGGNIPWSDIVLNFTAQIFVSWLYYRTHRSVLIAMLLHFSSNYVAEIVFSLFEGGDFTQFNWLKTGLACLIAIGLIIFDRQLWFARPSPAQPEIVSEPVAGI